MSPLINWNLRERSSIIYRLLHFIDCGLACLFLWIYTHLYKVPWNFYYTRLEIITFTACFISFHIFQMYRSWRGWKFYREFLVITQAWSAVVGLLLFYFFIFKNQEAYSRFVFMIWVLTTPLLIFCAHLLVRYLLRRLRAQGRNIRHAIVCGAGELGERMVRQLEEIPWAGIEVVGFFDDKTALNASASVMGKPIIGRIDQVEEYLRCHDIDYVYIALPMRAEYKVLRLLRNCRDLGAQIFLVPDLYVYGVHHAEIQSMGEMLVLNFNPDASWKRTFDVVFSSVVLACIWPLFLLIGLLIKLDSPGPVLYRHRRLTTAGREFDCLKFRSMINGAEEMLEPLLQENPERREEWERYYKLKDDPRVTRIGRFLRKRSLDELPQFINVLKGDMSVVGARPIIGPELEEYYKSGSKNSAGLYCSMKPGITGLWQMLRRSDIDNYDERVELDDYYVLNHSLRQDLVIIGKTIMSVLNGKGAY
ncbi:MAG: UDP-phosphate galactose phosphotransferase [Desulfobulbus propionicus]|nr:MAG: UDP-phosphate galactose phosphotransferase [Desulfobulbus propionicus]